jgi:hypothetical protein
MRDRTSRPAPAGAVLSPLDAADAAFRLLATGPRPLALDPGALFLTIGGVRYVLAGGDPAEVERAKTAFRSAAIGYALAILAPVVVTVLRSLVGG